MVRLGVEKPARLLVIGVTDALTHLRLCALQTGDTQHNREHAGRGEIPGHVAKSP